MITKIELTNFKSHAHTVIEPGRVTALVGPNGCGKSSTLEAIKSLIRLLSSDVENAFGDDDRLYELTRRGYPTFKIALEGLAEETEYEVIFENDFDFTFSNIDVPGAMFVYGENESRFRWKLNNKENGLSSFPIKAKIIDLITDKAITAEFLKLAIQVGESLYIKTNYDDLISPSDALKMLSTGKGLASVIANQKTEFDERHVNLERLLRSVIPQIKSIRARRVEIIKEETETIRYEEAVIPVRRNRPVNGYELIFDMISGEKIPAKYMSEGTMLTLGLLTALTMNPQCKTFFIDDVEAGLHPLAQRKLMQVLKDFAEKHDRQIILTSHSPYIVDALDAKDVWVMATDKEGISHTKRLSDHPDAERALDVLTTGELWDAEGESWVLENTPAELANA
jgi:AAA15 family ATPase/GTPase